MNAEFVIELESSARDIDLLIKENENFNNFSFKQMEKYDLILEKIIKIRKELKKNMRLYLDEFSYANYLISFIEKNLHFNKSQYSRYKKLNILKNKQKINKK